MNIYLQNLEQARAKTLHIWNNFPEQYWLWKPDAEAMHFLATVRHTLSAQLWFANLIITKGDVSKITMPNESELPFTNLEYELQLGQKHTATLYNLIKSFSDDDFNNYIIERTDKPFTMNLGNFLLRAAYHEAHHNGQLLHYLRLLHVDRPNIWDIY
jgi:uncharacterized damage-inducible protein DinB